MKLRLFGWQSFLLLFALSLTINAQDKTMEIIELPLKKLSQDISVVDDLNFEGLELAIQRQFEAFKRFPPKGHFLIEGTRYPRSILKDSLEKLQQTIDQHKACLNMNELNACKHQTSEIFKQSFSFFRPQKSEKNNKKALFTAYYSPIIEANYKKSEQYPHAIYARPEDERLRFDSQRVGIDLDGALEGHGLELFYANNLYELYILHIEGGGKVVVKNSEKNYYLSFDGTNKQRWNFLSQYMIEQGYIKSHDMREQKLFLDAHPEKWREIYSLCPSYVYFKLTDTPPEGLDGIPLTDHRSMAQDRSIYSQKGLIGLVESKRPIQRPDGSITYIPFKRIYIDQDTGGAIKGEARADLYFGENEKAKIAGQNMKQEGAMTFLLSLPQE